MFNPSVSVFLAWLGYTIYTILDFSFFLLWGWFPVTIFSMALLLRFTNKEDSQTSDKENLQ